MCKERTAYFTLTHLFMCWLVAGCAAALPAGDHQENSQNSGIVLSWSRQGGLAGFCDELEVTASGDVTARSCATASTGSTASSPTAPKRRKLSPAEMKRLDEFRQTLASMTFSTSSPADAATADAMKQTIRLAGKGRSQASETQKRELMDWAQTVYSTPK